MTLTQPTQPPLCGLTSAEVQARLTAGKVNSGVVATSRPWLSIVRSNVFTRFNALLGSMFVLILVIGPIQDSLFGIILIVNTSIGVAQEMRARRTLDRLALVNEPHARSVRDGEVREIPQEDVVLDEVIELRRGDQVVVDGQVIASSGLELDESLLSGEAEPVPKPVGESVLSGSAVVAGTGFMKATAVGPQAFAQGLASEAKRFSVVRSELQEANNTILRYVTWAIVPVAVVLCWSQLSLALGVREALRGAVAGVANMIPEGLVLLTSVAYGVGAIRLARKRVLVRELAAVESLARVDVLCIDKTGTITTGRLRALEIRQLDHRVAAIDVVVGLAVAEVNPTASLRSLSELEPAHARLDCIQHVSFSSERRWSAATFDGLGTFVLGAPDVLLRGRSDEEVSRQIAAETQTGHRVLLLARAPDGLRGEDLPPSLEPVAFGVLAEEVRPDARATLSFLRSQGVEVKVISGDSPTTVAVIATEAGLPPSEPVDAATMPTDPEHLAAILDVTSIFGRVGPREKRAIVAALQASGHVVAMTGDGVNDVLALRDADLGIAMGSGSPASRAAGRVVLLDDSFSVMPALLSEGRRVLANVERVSKLFVTKTIYASLLALAIAVARVPFPFYPRNFTLISTLTIGIPAFVLALPPAATRLRAGYLRRVRTFVVPTGIVLAAATTAAYLIDRTHGGSTAANRTTATLVLGTLGLWVLQHLSRPYNWWKVALVGSMAGLFVLAIALPSARQFFALQQVTEWTLALWAIVSGVAVILLEVIWRLGRSTEESRTQP